MWDTSAYELIYDTNGHGISSLNGPIFINRIKLHNFKVNFKAIFLSWISAVQLEDLERGCLNRSTVAWVVVPVNNIGATVARQTALDPQQRLFSKWRAWAAKGELTVLQSTVVEGHTVVVGSTAVLLLPPFTRSNAISIFSVLLLDLLRKVGKVITTTTMDVGVGIPEQIRAAIQDLPSSQAVALLPHTAFVFQTVTFFLTFIGVTSIFHIVVKNAQAKLNAKFSSWIHGGLTDQAESVVLRIK